MGRLGYHATDQSLVLNYRTRPYGADWRSVTEAVPIDRAPCRYSQSEPAYDRALRRANKRRTALGGQPGAAHLIAPKPKGMWQRTYQRKRLEIERAENKANQLFLSKFRHLLTTEDRALFLGTLL